MKLKLTQIIGTLSFLVISHGFSQSLLTEAHLTGLFGAATVTNLINLTIGIEPRVDSQLAELFEDLFVQTNDVGHTYIIGPGDDPDFATFVTYLTDGYVSFFSVDASMGPGGGGESGVREVNFFTGLPPGNNGVDLGGFVIDHFSLRFDTLETTSPGSDPNGDGVWTDCSYAATFSVYGQAVNPPQLPPVSLSGTNLVWNFTNGFPYEPFYVVASTNILLASTYWIRVVTNQFDQWGRRTLILPIEPDKPRRFYRIALPVQ
jgi:hypothetical protein